MENDSQDQVFDRGDQVVLRGRTHERGVVVSGPRRGATGYSYDVFFGTNRTETVPAHELELWTRRQVGWVNRQRFLRDMAYLKLRHQYSDVLYSMGASRTRFLVYQFAPVLKFIQSLPHGVLIADEVGLGKTIEAGLILKELLARGSVRRVLVVCPANLCEKWRGEMQQRFGLQFSRIAADDVRNIRRDTERTGWPDFFAIASLEGLRRADQREALQTTGIQFDLVVVDEAHHLRNPETQSFELGEILSDQADHILLLSATPVQTGSRDLLSLLRLVAPAEFGRTTIDDLDEILEPNLFINAALAQLAKPHCDAASVAEVLEGVLNTNMAAAFKENAIFAACVDRLRQGALDSNVLVEVRRDLQRLHTLAPYFTRTRKREVEEAAGRRSHVIHVELSPQEAEFYSAWVDYATSVARLKSPRAPTAWAVSMRERQAASSLQSAREALEGLIEGAQDLGVETTDPDADPDEIAWWSTDHVAAEQALRSKVVEAAQAVGATDTKAARFVEAVRDLIAAKAARKILVFTFFKGTLRHLARELTRARIGHSVMSGDDAPDRRGGITEAFQEDPDQSVLLCTEVAAEGLDFQFCDAVINYDLPWNPMRVEQRIGRIDRFGQVEPIVHVVSFFVEGTIDSRILERLYERIGVFEHSIGELEPILGPIVRELERDAFSSQLSDEEQIRRAEDAIRRVEALRLQQEELEASRAELIGHADLVRQEIESTKTSGRFISPEELHALVRDWLATSNLSKDDIHPTERPGIWNLRLSDRSIGEITTWLARERRTDPLTNRLLARIRDRGNAWCTFDSGVAQRLDNLAFIDVGHPVLRVALDFADRTPPGHPFERVCSLKGLAGADLTEPIVLFVYRLMVKGAEPRTSMLPIAIAAESEAVLSDDIGEALLGSLPEAAPGPSAPLDPDTLSTLEDLAFDHADHLRARAQDWAADTQQARLATRRAAIERSYRVRIERKKELRARVADQSIQRLREGEIRNLETALTAKLAEIDATPEPLATLDLVAVAVFTG